jgi:hypothetical protein
MSAPGLMIELARLSPVGSLGALMDPEAAAWRVNTVMR